ncbi:DUF4149 domain-containing protein [Aspergillus alliaceus]|uniref:DUF4149 domain-containing protein n=1 Tax=Petromyces alliaceus TaxID=209559 RepID=UPI0012A3C688|nr:uncharacterized protein BDW43DRAFT_310054 [Aspergillus alliaceus]KAB8234800.1 hypothetical protein BDW43DRAFT_310054 [Aspergillus alliaceus]
MQNFINTVSNLLPYHLLSYGTLLDTEIFRFIALQKRIFPAQFKCQVGLIILTVATRPPCSVISFTKHAWDAIPLVIVGVTGGLNWITFGPRTTTAAVVRRTLQEQAIGEDNPDPTDPATMHQVNRKFSVNHAMSIHLNAVALVATVWYGFSLASSLLSGCRSVAYLVV